MGENNGKQETKDLYLAAYLKLRGFNLVGARIQEGRIVYFRFVDTPQLRDIEDEYWDRKPVFFAPLNWLHEIRRVRAIADDTLKRMSDELPFESTCRPKPS